VLGRYPTSVQRLDKLSLPSTELWVKRDDLTNDFYGGNKVRKLEHIFEAASARGARRVLTAGAAGSHHVLATALHGRRAGLRVAALLVPQLASVHAEETLRAAIGSGLEAFPVRHWLALPLEIARARQAHDYVVPPGGSNVTGSLGYFAAAEELLGQVQAGALPAPDIIVVALGSSGTAAGLLAGLVASGYRGTLLAVRVVEPWHAGALSTRMLASAVLRRARPTCSRAKLGAWSSDLGRRLRVAGGYLGRGYGLSTEAGDRATKLASEQGLVLEPTYTAKAFAAALDRVTEGAFKRVLFWHTFSSAPLQPILAGAPGISELPTALRTLLVRKTHTS
jgi:1-aminocyclopropane-1-carboxylate deaminase/D-cysteine desulfhydrase-like pyridoxal-dependent ACC family enzyme